MDKLGEFLADVWTKSPRFTTGTVMVSMCSEKGHESPNLVSSHYELIIWRIVEEPWDI
jgi:hypothetical protein